jgi:hypothetical protein
MLNLAVKCVCISCFLSCFYQTKTFMFLFSAGVILLITFFVKNRAKFIYSGISKAKKIVQTFRKTSFVCMSFSKMFISTCISLFNSHYQMKLLPCANSYKPLTFYIRWKYSGASLIRTFWFPAKWS